MALVRTNKVSGQSATSFGTGSYTPSSFTSDNSSLLVVIVGSGNGFGNAFDPTITDSQTLSWTTVGTSAGTGGGWDWGIRVFRAFVTTGGAGHTVTIDHGAASIWDYSVVVLSYTGHDGTTPIAGLITDNATVLDGAESVTLSATPDAADEAVAAFLRVNDASQNASTTFGTGWTEQYDLSGADGDTLHIQTRTGSTSTTVGWDDVAVGGTLFESAALAFIVKADAAAGATGSGTPSLAALTSAGTGTHTAPAVPDAITDLAGTAGDTQVVLTWTAPANNGSSITDYIVQYRRV